MSSDAAPTPQSDPEATPEQYRQRALLLADLGRYDEAAGEIAAGLTAAPGNPDLLTTLARVHLAAEQPVEALTAAARAVAAAPGTIGPLVVRAIALVDNRDFAEAAGIAAELLRRWPDDPYAQRTGAALLSESRNGQEALNAAWSAVRLSATDADAHLVLAVVSARLRLFDLAQRAYAEALELDPALGDAQRDLGVVRLERRRWANALERLADAAALAVPPEAGAPGGDPLAHDQARAPGAARAPDADSLRAAISRPAGPVLDTFSESAGTIRQAVLVGANAIMIAVLLTAVMASASSGASRVWAGMIGIIVLAAFGLWLRRKLTEPVAAALRRVRQRDRRLAVATYCTVAAPVLILVYALVGGLVPLVAALVVAAAAELTVLTHRH